MCAVCECVGVWTRSLHMIGFSVKVQHQSEGKSEESAAPHSSALSVYTESIHCCFNLAHADTHTHRGAESLGQSAITRLSTDHAITL